jgi:2-haloacid dehalogenase
MRTQASRREFLQTAGLGSAAAIFISDPLRAQGAKMTAPKAMVFDTFGTVVDWRGSIIAEGATWGRAKGITVDWAHFADRWRSSYGPAMNKVRKGELPWTKLDVLHRMILDGLLVEFNITGLTEEEKDHWNRVWHRLTPWPDSVAGLARLKKKYTIATLSNGNVALLTDMAKHAGLPWDAILSAELAKHYKPDHEVYLTAADLLGLKPAETMMVAAHLGDLRAARACGLQTGFIHRPNEYGPGRKGDAAKPGDFDVVAEDMLDLAAKMGA